MAAELQYLFFCLHLQKGVKYVVNIDVAHRSKQSVTLAIKFCLRADHMGGDDRTQI